MGKKRNREEEGGKKRSKWWCYYCEAESKDETALIMHQRAKHFRCPHCEPGYPGGHCHGIDGLFSHVRRSHNKELLEVPGAMASRKDPSIMVEGMSGVPDHLLDDYDESKVADAAPAPPPWGYTSSAPPMVHVPKKKEPEAPVAKPPQTTDQNISAMMTALLSSGNAQQAGLAAALAQLQNGNLSPALAAALLTAGPDVTSSPGLQATLASMAPGMPGFKQIGVNYAIRPPPTPGGVTFLVIIERVCGHWEDSNGKLIVITAAPNCTVSVKHETRGNQVIKYTDFVKKGKVAYAGREGTLEGNTLEWDNGAVWAKVCQEF